MPRVLAHRLKALEWTQALQPSKLSSIASGEGRTRAVLPLPLKRARMVCTAARASPCITTLAEEAGLASSARPPATQDPKKSADSKPVSGVCENVAHDDPRLPNSTCGRLTRGGLTIETHAVRVTSSLEASIADVGWRSALFSRAGGTG